MIERISAIEKDITVIHHDGLSEYALNIPQGNLDAAQASPGLCPAEACRLIQFQFDGEMPLGTVKSLMWLHGDGASASPSPSACQILAVDGATVREIELEGQTVGYTYADDYADYCWLSGLLPEDPAASRMDQAGSCLERLAASLAAAGMTPADIVRTWFFLDRLFEWYDGFNHARDAFFERHGIFERYPPASTGIGAANHAGAALVAGALAIRPRREDCRFMPVSSPLQCPATDYRRSFSRAMEMSTPQWRKLFISGTASIGPDGRTLHAGDLDRQIGRTLDVCEALLASRRMKWSDVTRAIAYFSDARESGRLARIIEERSMPDLPLIIVQGLVCREDLLFEIELDAFSSQSA